MLCRFAYKHINSLIKKTMIKTFIISAVFFLVGFNEIKDVNIDTTASTITWVGKKVTGQHNGTILLKSGSLEMQDDQLTGGRFTIDMTSIICEDLSGEYKDKLEGHLKSKDFFNVEVFNDATFTITKAVPQGVGNYKVVGDITIKGITKEISFSTSLKNDNGKITATSDITIDRSNFNVRYGSGSFFDNLGDKTIYDNFDLSVTLVSK